MGTANYMAPERILQLPLDPRSDLFSLGVVMYEMATGRLPFAGPSPSETVANVLDKDPVPLTNVAPQHPKSLEQIVQRLLAKRAGDRDSTATELTAALVGSPPRIRDSARGCADYSWARERWSVARYGATHHWTRTSGHGFWPGLFRCRLLTVAGTLNFTKKLPFADLV